ncbi:uncharacterized protein LOC125766294 isoform X1 [Anopheles funestus]|uniref:uncharacterized protein LOC125766294 isoform X1 n=1 Tax=Anopheles funestus TaxID=62324 RepID=UPI0020C6A6CA|nr:uncharacterized protein LOC125766294 isoform X1 [Anopheles funestus]XP_049288063.1 uncharacterized protein LOC125766294 isoform X1 [Anopheles funestus]XP_049288064.1 uncharacterized protein LOC125766294 isoform X1 [Anopheles funestus]XP_049288065.1 uncharacterized protein LOC125766294 isoform X1 [Anopheles funestus]XP_049288067.1 uncharacterized protein LOC125766294 isoform X1 [Anopheles funestus]
MKQSAQSETSVAPGNIGSYGMFNGTGGHTNTNNRKRQLVESGAFALFALTVAVLCTSVSATTEPTIVNATSVTEFPVSNSSTGRASSRPMFSTGNHLWDALIAECMRKPTFACIQKNVYSFLGEQLDVENVNFTNRVQFLRNRVDFTKYTREANDANDGEEDSENEIPDARSAFEPSSPIEEVTTALREKSLKFMLTHDVSVQMPEVMFDGAIFRIQPRAIEGNGMIAKLEFVPRTELAEARGHGTPRILFKKIKKFFQNKLLLAFLAIVLIIKIIKIKVMWLLPLLVGVGTAKKLVLKFLLFLFPALAHIFKLCSYYHASYHKPNFHHHQHHINHLHTFYPHEHATPELIYTKPPRGHPSEFLHGAPVPPHTHYQPEVNYEFTAPGLGSEFISDRNSYVDTSFKPKYDDLNDIKAWGLGESTNTSAPQSSPYFTSPPTSPNGAVGGSGSYNVNPLTQHAASRVHSPKPVYGPPGYSSSAQKRIPTGAATSIAAQYVSAPSGPTLSAEEQIIREAQRQEAYRIAQEQKLISKQQAIVNQQAYVQEGVTPRPVDPFYSPILQRLDKVFNSLGIVDESCRERLVCSMYKSPVKYSPHSNYVSAELSRDASELQKPTSTNAAVVRFYRYVQAARDGQDQRDCQRIYSQCTINMEKKKK